MIFSLGFVEIISLPRKGIIRGVFLANHLASTDNLTNTIKRQNTYKRKTNNAQKKVALIKTSQTQKKLMLLERTERAWISLFYNIRPRNGVGLFFHSLGPHRAYFSSDHSRLDPQGLSNNLYVLLVQDFSQTRCHTCDMTNSVHAVKR